ncbi:tubulin binding cofactor A family protein [Cryptosporidium ryanae]|uniref:tubulin binding cofactor A family protein n=1 Tax=Cryptosporidium ryanae TaxID=515981 RepID=UPI003519F760|nr:tubulin binding cofactor A family protein [Cryptosporidium ryanae]
MQKQDILKQLQIKTSSIKRMTKDLEMYKKEEEEFKNKIEEMKNQGRDIHDIQQQEKCLHETLLVYRDVLKKLSIGYSDLHKYLCENFKDSVSEIISLSDNTCNDDQKSKLVLSAYSEMKRVQSEYGNLIKLESLTFADDNSRSSTNDEYV